MHDFDFLIGKSWRITNRVLKERLSGCDEWQTFESRLFGAHTILDGHGNIDQFEGRREGQPFFASSIRIFNPNTATWTIYWVDSVGHQVLPQVVGRFENGVGTFEGEESHDGRTYRLRFRWTDVRADSARWEQAYLDERNGTWETNWIMEFRLDGVDG